MVRLSTYYRLASRALARSSSGTRALSRLLTRLNGKDLLRVSSEHVAERFRIRRDWTTLVIEHRERFAQRLAAIENAQQPQEITVGPQCGRHNRDAMSGLCHGQ